MQTQMQTATVMAMMRKGVDEEGHKTITIKGTKYRLEADEEEVILPSDPDGDKKVDEKVGCRRQAVQAYNFTSDLRADPEKVYMLAIEAARIGRLPRLALLLPSKPSNLQD